MNSKINQHELNHSRMVSSLLGVMLEMTLCFYILAEDGETEGMGCIKQLEKRTAS